MNYLQEDSNRLIEIVNGVDEAIIIFKLEKNTGNNELFFINPTCKEVMSEYYHGSFNNIKLEDIFGLSREELIVFTNKKIEGNELHEERTLFSLSDNSEIYNLTYNIYNYSDEMLIQITIKTVKANQYMSDLSRLEKSVDKMIFNKGYVVLLAVKNYEQICSLYGIDSCKAVMNTIEREVLKNSCKSSSFDRAFKTLVFVLSESYEKPSFFINDLLSRVHKSIIDSGINILCDLKIGMSSLSSNRYKAFKEAKYAINEIYSSDKIINDYAALKDHQMLEYIIKNDLPYAIDKDEFEVYFQGVFDTSTSQLFGFEVLIRWTHGKLGSISPAEFIPIAEDLDLISKIDLWVINKALKEFEEMNINNKDSLKLNFNISPKDLLKTDFIDNAIELIENRVVDYNNIIFEITETLNLLPEKEGIKKLKSKGILIALDDFGTGFSSLSQIKYYDIDYLKIDISFIRDINKNYDNTLITNAILALAKSLKIKVIAEGVEELEQIDFLRFKKCDYLQGYMLHKPSDKDSIVNDLSKEAYIKFSQKNNDMKYKDYVGFYQYGKLIYLSTDYQGEIINCSGLLSKTIDYEIRPGEFIESIIINSYVESFRKHIIELKETGKNKSFMTELVGLKESIPVKVTMMKDTESSTIDIFLEDYREKREDFLRTRNVYNRYDLVFSNINTAIIISDSNLIIHDWNKKAEEVFGYKREEVIGENMIKLLVGEYLQDDISVIAYNTLQGNVTENINENITKNNERIVCRWKNTLLPNDSGETVGFISWVEDITEKLRIEEEINTLSTVIKQKPNPVVITNLDGEIEYVNNAFTKLTGYSYEEVIGQNPRILSSGYQSKDYYKKLWDTIESGKLWEGEFKNKKKNGEIYITESRVFPIKNEDVNIIKYCSIQQDVTKDIEKDNIIREINNTLENQERLSMVGQMAAGIIHEINNPLSYVDMNVESMVSFIKMIEDGKNVSEAISELYELQDDLKEGIDSIKEIASGLKKFAYKGRTRKFDMVNLNEEIQTISVVTKNEYKYYCEMEIIEGDISEIYGDAGKIKQVLLNLLINAVYAIKDKGDGWGKITIRTYEEDDFVCCDVEDNGKGIPEEIQDMIFESFFTTKEEGVGTGLGLSLSKKIIEVDHKGILTFNSVENKGTTFSLKFKKGVQ
jgi:PAS domain S-box-containing protein